VTALLTDLIQNPAGGVFENGSVKLSWSVTPVSV
jgi:hypothetical protein